MVNFNQKLKKMNFLKNLFNLFFPDVCLSCKLQLSTNEKTICTRCRHDFPLTEFTNYPNNLVEKRFIGRIPIIEATALLYFHKKGKSQQLIHELKYKGHQEIGAFLGNWLGDEILESNRFKKLDFIVPVPLHPKKLKKRGYNQLTKFGKALSKKLEIPFIEDKLMKGGSTETQTLKGKIGRWRNVQELFELNDISYFENKHLLLIDDVITTGATMESCCNELFKTKNVKISIAVMAYTE